MESDQERMSHAPARAFDWVARELVLPSDESRKQLCAAFLAVVYEGHSKAVRTLERAWPKSAHWPSGEAYLRTLGWRHPDELEDDDDADAYADAYEGPELIELLFARLFHVAHRLYRDEQVRRVLDPNSPTRIKHYTGARVNGFSHWLDEDPCGLGVDRIISVAEALALLEQPAHPHPACHCSVDPHPV